MEPYEGRLAILRAKYMSAMKHWKWHDNVHGLTLNFDFLRRMGVREHFLSEWEDGVSLGGHFNLPRSHRNHPSVREHAVWAETEWSRLEN